MSDKSVKESVKETVLLCAERGWRISLTLVNEEGASEILKGLFITAVDENQKAIVVERAGERHLPPRIVHMEEIQSAEAIWGKE